MYSLVIASHQLRLPFTLVRSLVVSNPVEQKREGWPYVDALPDDMICPAYGEGRNNGLYRRADMADHSLPVGLHYCQRYLIGRVRFGWPLASRPFAAGRTTHNALYLSLCASHMPPLPVVLFQVPCQPTNPVL